MVDPSGAVRESGEKIRPSLPTSTSKVVEVLVLVVPLLVEVAEVLVVLL